MCLSAISLALKEDFKEGNRTVYSLEHATLTQLECRLNAYYMHTVDVVCTECMLHDRMHVTCTADGLFPPTPRPHLILLTGASSTVRVNTEEDVTRDLLI